VKRTLKRELKVLEIVNREANEIVKNNGINRIQIVNLFIIVYSFNTNYRVIG